MTSKKLNKLGKLLHRSFVKNSWLAIHQEMASLTRNNSANSKKLWTIGRQDMAFSTVILVRKNSLKRIGRSLTAWKLKIEMEWAWTTSSKFVATAVCLVRTPCLRSQCQYPNRQDPRIKMVQVAMLGVLQVKAMERSNMSGQERATSLWVPRQGRANTSGMPRQERATSFWVPHQE